MKQKFLCALVIPALLLLAPYASAKHSPAAAVGETDTIVLVRHGEKPKAGLGQLNCQGLNRALALPPVIAKLFGKPTALFAPDPSQRKEDHGVAYNYIRPLITIEPTAITFGLPVDTTYGVSDVDGLTQALQQQAHGNAFLLVAWEHHQIENIARELMSAYGADPSQVPKWHGDDFDSIYIIRVTRTGNTTAASFERQAEGLDGQPINCR